MGLIPKKYIVHVASEKSSLDSVIKKNSSKNVTHVAFVCWNVIISMT